MSCFDITGGVLGTILGLFIPNPTVLMIVTIAFNVLGYLCPFLMIVGLLKAKRISDEKKGGDSDLKK